MSRMISALLAAAPAAASGKHGPSIAESIRSERSNWDRMPSGVPIEPQ